MTRTLIAAALLAACAASHAADSVPTHWYVSGDIGVTRYTDKTLNDRYTDLVWGAALGYSPTPYLSIELVGRRLGAFDGIFESAYYPGTHYGVELVGNLPLSDHWVAYARAGYGTTTMESENGNRADYHIDDAAAGVGIRWDVAAHWSMTLGATRYVQSERTITALGLQYRF